MRITQQLAPDHHRVGTAARHDLLGLPRSGAEDDLVDEVYREYESSVLQGGEFDPVYALELKPDDPASLSAFKTALTVAKRSFELTGELYRTLEVTTCLFP